MNVFDFTSVLGYSAAFVVYSFMLLSALVVLWVWALWRTLDLIGLVIPAPVILLLLVLLPAIVLFGVTHPVG